MEENAGGPQIGSAHNHKDFRNILTGDKGFENAQGNTHNVEATMTNKSAMQSIVHEVKVNLRVMGGGGVTQTGAGQVNGAMTLGAMVVWSSSRIFC